MVPPFRCVQALFCACTLCSSSTSVKASPDNSLNCSNADCVEYLGGNQFRLVATGGYGCCYTPGNGVMIQLTDGVLETSELEGTLLFGQARIFPGGNAYNLRGLGLTIQPLGDWELAEAGLRWVDPAVEVGVFQDSGTYVVAYAKSGAFALGHQLTDLNMLLKAPERVAFDGSGVMYYSQDASGVEKFLKPEGCSTTSPGGNLPACLLVIFLLGSRIRKSRRRP